MNVDIYRRQEPGNKLSYLVVPAGQPIPHEAENVDWQLRESNAHIDEAAGIVHPYEIEKPREQIGEKGYAITRVANQVPADRTSA